MENDSELTCLRCEHKWTRRKKQVRVCPRCHSPYWNKPGALPKLNPSSSSIIKWSPGIGIETMQLLRNQATISDESKAKLQEEALKILSKCARPDVPDRQTTGLVVGHIQSGKTMSFTTVAALARDNRYQMIIVIGGISKPLFDQSCGRLKKDLRIQERTDHKWRFRPNPTQEEIQTIYAGLQSWNDPNIPEKLRSTILITVMKHHTHLDHLIQVLEQLREKLEMRRVPVLIIDDEADQAGLNTKIRHKDTSATYRRLIAIRELLPHHSFLQYTATPQAPLLINLIDVLSPSFAEILEPGPDYVGGRQFFIDSSLDLIKTIPFNEIPTGEAELLEPPDSLIEAMRLFFLGVAAGYELDEGEGHRSMMVHPSRLKIDHTTYHRWVNDIKNRWEHVLDNPSKEVGDRRDLISEFQNSYAELRRTANLPPFNILLKYLSLAVRDTRVTLINSEGQEIKWEGVYSHILVGGQAMDRGFTVKGLTVTYMPRGIGTGQADTIQQRARFFGYKRHYLGYCRVYLDQHVRNIYSQYVRHEENVRGRLRRHCDTGQPLSSWKRAFFLSKDLKPTRRQVLGLDYMQGRYDDKWVVPDSPHFSPESLSSNRIVIREFLGKLNFLKDPTHSEHYCDKTASLRLVYEEFLSKLTFSLPEDSEKMTGALLQIEGYLENNPQTTCVIYKMRPDQQSRRALTEDDRINTVHQGPDPADGSRYPGDSRIKDADCLTIQIYNLTLDRGEKNGDKKKKQIIAENVPAIAVWMPGKMAMDWLVQDQGIN